MHDTDTDVTAGQELICGETTNVVYVALIDAHGHPHQFPLDLDTADQLADQLAAAVSA